MFYSQDQSLFTAIEFPFDNFESKQWKMKSLMKEEEEGLSLSYVFTDGNKSIEGRTGDWVVLSDDEKLEVYPNYIFNILFADA